MPASYVLDASAVALGFLQDERGPAFRDWLRLAVREEARLLAPVLLPYELANVVHKEFGRTPHSHDPDFALRILRSALAMITLRDEAWADTWRWAGTLSSYDASYLSLADTTGATLVTYDARLAKVARGVVPVIGATGLP